MTHKGVADAATPTAHEAEALMYAGRYLSADRRVRQDMIAGRMPSKDDMAKLERYASLARVALLAQGPVPEGEWIKVARP